MVLMNKILEIKLMQFGIPRTELNAMAKEEIIVLIHLVEYMSRETGKKEDEA
jgi:hypothetical protein